MIMTGKGRKRDPLVITSILSFTYLLYTVKDHIHITRFDVIPGPE